MRGVGIEEAIDTGSQPSREPQTQGKTWTELIGRDEFERLLNNPDEPEVAERTRYEPHLFLLQSPPEAVIGEESGKRARLTWLSNVASTGTGPAANKNPTD
ncbi:MAG TPA: hypothetical protein VMM76_06370 [Pirellulaceae bacterium]|nr:hypothetical protein [Pirellulaceae bacterium]